MVHVNDPRVQWGIPAAQVVRITATSWLTAATDLLATLAPLPPTNTHSRRVMIVRGDDNRETALLAVGPIGVIEVDPADILPLPDELAVASPQISAIVVSHDASLALLFKPSAVTSPDDRAS